MDLIYLFLVLIGGGWRWLEVVGTDWDWLEVAGGGWRLFCKVNTPFLKHAVNLFKSYLSNIPYLVNLGNNFSQPASVLCNVPQGSIFCNMLQGSIFSCL